nr:MAG TPA: hypothetical protein [Caudoviricetes sp.]
MTTAQAYQIVFRDIVDKDCGFLVGRFDAQHGNKSFMYGVQTTMEYLAYMAGPDAGEKFMALFEKNFLESLDKAREM